MMAILQLIGGLLLLLAGGELLVRGAVGIAKKFNVPTLIIGLTIVSLGTSAPELLVSVNAALSGSPDISIGNVIGSNIANLALVLGVTAMILAIPVAKNTLRIDWPVMAGATILFCLFIQDGLLSFLEGAILLVGLILYMVFLFYQSRRNAKKEALEEVIPEMEESAEPSLKNMMYLILGIAGLVFGAELLVSGATQIARSLGVSEYVIGVTIVAFGTSVPELATSMVAALKRQLDISVGNLIGSNIFNILGILGVTAMVKEIPVNDKVISSDIFWVLGITFMVLLLALHKMKVHKWKGLLLFLIYCAYIYLVQAA